MTRILTMTLATLLAPLAACMPAMMAGHTAPAMGAAPATAPTSAPGTAPTDACPMAVPGAQVTASDTPDGEALTFTTTSGDVAELRRRVHGMAEMHGRHHAAGAGMEHGHGGMGHGEMMGGGMAMGGSAMEGGQGAGGHGSHAMAIPPSRAAVEDVENGARVVVTPNDPADLEKLRSAARMHAQHMQQHGCEMTGRMNK